MFNVCPACGIYSVEKTIDPAGPYAVCPHCGYAHPFLRQPLFVVTGASGTGKTTICLALAPRMTECIALESDVLWGPEFDTPEDNYRRYRDVWLRLAKNIGQAGRPVALFGSAVPEQLEDRPERRYFSAIHYLALVCDDAILVERLRSRPAWRQAGSPEFIDRMLAFNRWLKENAANTHPPMDTLDTTGLSIEQSAGHTADWIRRRL